MSYCFSGVWERARRNARERGPTDVFYIKQKKKQTNGGDVRERENRDSKSSVFRNKHLQNEIEFPYFEVFCINILYYSSIGGLILGNARPVFYTSDVRVL